MKPLVVFCIIIALFYSCKKDKAIIKQEPNTISPTSFNIKGTLENLNTSKVYLNKIFNNSYIPVDSSNVTNNTFVFKGIVEYPERFALTYKGYASTTVFIIENSTFQINLNGSTPQTPIIIGSKLNNELEAYKTKAKQIFKKIEYLFPKFQKARLENDVEELALIGEKINQIENEFTVYTFNYIQNNKNSFVSAMLLRDQLKTTTIDTLKISEMYNILNSEIKKCPDATIIATEFNLH